MLRALTLAGEIDLEDVFFSYPTAPDHQVCRGYSLTIGAGQTVALCGPSGAGKSTIIQLVERFYDPQSGCVRLATYVVDGQRRYDEERALKAREVARAEAAGSTSMEVGRSRAESVATPFAELDDLRARLNGLDPKNPFVTQRAGTGYFWCVRARVGGVVRPCV